MKPKYFPLSIFLWTVGFSTFAQPDRLSMKVENGLCLEIEKESNQWISIVGHTTKTTQTDQKDQTSTALIKLAKSEMFENIKFLPHVSESDCDLTVLASIDIDALRGYVWHFDFDAMQLCRVEPQKGEPIGLKGYQKIKSRFNSDGIAIEIEIRRKRYVLNLDFGFDGFMMLETDASLPFFKDNHSVIQTLRGEFRDYPHKVIKFMETYYSSNLVLGEESIIGMDFIKGFNWIIDMRRRELYVKKNGVSLNSTGHAENKAIVKNGTLIVSASDRKKSKLRPGDRIVSIDAEAISQQNACEWATRLNNASSWKAFKVETSNSQP